MLERGGRGLAWNERDAERERDLGETRRENEKKSEMEGGEREEREREEGNATHKSLDRDTCTSLRAFSLSLFLSLLLVLRSSLVL